MHMQQIVSITSQGQITIPAAMRRAINIDKYDKASITTENNKIIVEPVTDLLSLGGKLKNRAKKQKNIDAIIKMEEEIVGKMIK